MLWRCLKNKEVSLAYIRVIKDMYEEWMTSVRTPRGIINDFSVVMGLH